MDETHSGFDEAEIEPAAMDPLSSRSTCKNCYTLRERVAAPDRLLRGEVSLEIDPIWGREWCS